MALGKQDSRIGGQQVRHAEEKQDYVADGVSGV